METPNATHANEALWSHYIQQQWGSVLPGGALAPGFIGLAIANAYAAAWGDFIGELFASNAPQVTAFVQKERSETRSAPTVRRHPSSSAIRRVAEPATAAAQRARERERVLMPVGVG